MNWVWALGSLAFGGGLALLINVGLPRLLDWSDERTYRKTYRRMWGEDPDRTHT